MVGDVILVHGAWSNPADWRWVEERLAQSGVSVHALDLASHRSADATRADDVKQVAGAVAAASGPTVVVGWSYGGSVMTDLDVGGLGIARLVYFSAIPGLPPSDEQEPAPSMEVDVSHIAFGDDGTAVLDNDWFVDADPAVATMSPEVIEHLRSHPRRPITLEAVLAPQVRAAWRDVDTTVILGSTDELISEEQRRWVIDAIPDVRVAACDHFILWRHPELIAEAVIEAVIGAHP